MKKLFLTLLSIPCCLSLWAQTGEAGSPLLSLVPCQVSFLTPRFAETVEWYRQKLGFQLVESWKDDYVANRAAHLELNGFGIEILELGEEGAAAASAALPDPAVTGTAPKPYQHIAFRVNDLGAALLALKAKGVEVLAGPVTENDGEAKFCFIKDNNGNAIKLIQHARATYPSGSRP
jgi:catechol 2,3-dioxygenase-like lactoylglutathione lyase family enzyme